MRPAVRLRDPLRAAALGHRRLLGDGPTEDEFKYGVETLQRAAEKAQARNIVLAMEYLNRFENYFLTTTAQTSGLSAR